MSNPLAKLRFTKVAVAVAVLGGLEVPRGRQGMTCLRTGRFLRAILGRLPTRLIPHGTTTTTEPFLMTSFLRMLRMTTKRKHLTLSLQDEDTQTTFIRVALGTEKTPDRAPRTSRD